MRVWHRTDLASESSPYITVDCPRSIVGAVHTVILHASTVRQLRMDDWKDEVGISNAIGNY